ncbi:GntR family transcriptional regulator [Rhodococcus sp. HNM0569]|uniref:GntR family transcriptional regulator n=1 Tax=Rhodococcus sp. HNM0569 TaxID=2716340 RepID=UPI00146A5E9F|nr:GntR family transcriptional regulator [Rhodococcus sp. HNM0569]NLU81300.1 GntR family transcriptional regulator [Rhodococcus sp. HNM0569]
MLIRVDPGSATPLAAQIAASIRGDLARGALAPGDRLPSARALADSIDVNLHTVLRAYAALRDEGVIDLRRGRGAVVRADVTAERVALADAADRFVARARRLGLSPDDMADLVRDAARHAPLPSDIETEEPT